MVIGADNLGRLTPSPGIPTSPPLPMYRPLPYRDTVAIVARPMTIHSYPSPLSLLHIEGIGGRGPGPGYPLQ